jgi:hypothetical protein
VEVRSRFTERAGAAAPTPDYRVQNCTFAPIGVKAGVCLAQLVRKNLHEQEGTYAPETDARLCCAFDTWDEDR